MYVYIGDKNPVFKKRRLDRLYSQAKSIMEKIKALSVTPDDLADPTKWCSMPFPFPYKVLPTPRFKIDESGAFFYMGRVAFHGVLSSVKNTFVGVSPKINVYGTKGYGKSHIIVAAVFSLLKEGSRVVFFPHARDFALENPYDYLRAAIVMAFADDDDALAEIENCLTVDGLTEWARYQDFILIVDQLNSLEEDSKISAEQKLRAQRILDDLSPNRVYLRGFSANNRTSVVFANTQRSERDILLFGGFEDLELAAYLHRKQIDDIVPVISPSDLDQLKDKSGCVPMYLEQFCDVYVKSKKNMCEAIGVFAMHLASEIAGGLGEFIFRCTDKVGFCKMAEDILLNHIIPCSPSLIDHRYFYRISQSAAQVEDGKGYAVCGIARDALAVVLRRTSEFDPFLSESWFNACNRATNPVIRGFTAEQIIISTIRLSGLRIDQILCPSAENRFFKTAAEAILSTEPSCTQYIPEPYNYKHVDSIVRYIVKNKKKKTLYLIALQPTLQEISQHINSLNFFSDDGDYREWLRDVPKDCKVEAHFVWIIPKKQYGKCQKSFPKEHPTYTEHCISFVMMNSKFEF